MDENERSELLNSVGNPRAEMKRKFKALVDEEGNGRDPHEIGKDTLRDLGHGGVVLKAIRLNCIECQGGNVAEVRRCHLVWCPMWPYRMGSNPFHTVTLSEKQREERSARLQTIQAARKKNP